MKGKEAIKRQMQMRAKKENEKEKKENLRWKRANVEMRAGRKRKQVKGVFTIGDVLPMSFHVVGDPITKRSTEMLVTVRTRNLTFFLPFRTQTTRPSSTFAIAFVYDFFFYPIPC